MAKYDSVNGQWPEGTDCGRGIKPSPQEAMAGAKRLYRVAMKRPFRGKVKLTSGRRDTRIRRHVLYVNPDWRGGGWHEIVHSISHHASYHHFRENHGPRHAFIERELTRYVVEHGWLEGKLKREPKAKPDLDIRALRRDRIIARIKKWEARRKRADTALKKLRRQRAYYDRMTAPPKGGAVSFGATGMDSNLRPAAHNAAALPG